jgi:hypothetical protein
LTIDLARKQFRVTQRELQHFSSGHKSPSVEPVRQASEIPICRGVFRIHQYSSFVRYSGGGTWLCNPKHSSRLLIKQAGHRWSKFPQLLCCSIGAWNRRREQELQRRNPSRSFARCGLSGVSTILPATMLPRLDNRRE